MFRSRNQNTPGKLDTALGESHWLNLLENKGSPRATWRDYTTDFAWSRLGVDSVETAKLSEAPENREVFPIILELLTLSSENANVNMNVSNGMAHTHCFLFLLVADNKSKVLVFLV